MTIRGSEKNRVNHRKQKKYKKFKLKTVVLVFKDPNFYGTRKEEKLLIEINRLKNISHLCAETNAIMRQRKMITENFFIWNYY